jgi:aminopeptidase N
VLAWPALLPLLAHAAPEGAPTPIADAPGEVMPTRWWDVEHLHLDVRIDIAAGTVEGSTTHTVAPLAVSRESLRLHQEALDITAVEVDGTPVDGWRTGPGRIEIPLAPGVRHEVTTRFRATPETGLHFRRPGRSRATRIREAWSQGEGEDHRHWFPSWDYPNDRFTVSIDVTARDGLTAVANGTLTGTAPAEDGWTTWSYRLDREIVNYLVVVSVGEYQTIELPGRIPLTVVGPAPTPPEVLVRGMDRIVPMLPWFDEVLGTPYPYPIYRQVMVQDFLYGGMENTTTTILADGLILDDPWDDPLRTEGVVAHELAHQWFGDLLTCYGWRELWLNEGFATYWTDRWMAHAHGEAYAAHRRRRSFQAALDTPRPMAARSWSKVDDVPNTAVYTRGSTVLHMLDVALGREAFDAAMRRYVTEHADRLVETEDLRRVLEDASGEHLGWLFDGWVHREGAPTWTVAHAWDEEADQLTITLTQTTKDRVWRAPMEIEIGTAAGPVVRRVWAGPGETRLVMDLEAPPRWVLADPRRAVLAHLEPTQEPQAWAAAALESGTWDGRLEAVHQLGEGEATAEALAALGTLLTDPELHPAVRGHAARALGELGTEAAAELLMEALDGAPDRLRRSIVAALGQHGASDALVARLEALHRRDPSPGVRGAALEALAQVDEARALARARRALGAPDPVRVAALKVIGRHGEARDVRRTLDALSADRTRWVRTTAARELRNGILRLERPADLRERATAALVPWLDSPDQRIRRTAVWVLGDVGDEPAARALEAFAARTTLERHQEQAREAADRIRRGDRPTGQDAKDPTDKGVKALERRLEGLEERLKDLEAWR